MICWHPIRVKLLTNVIYCGILLGMVYFNHFHFPPYTFCTVCKFMCTFGDLTFIAWMSPFVASRIKFYWLPSYLPGEHWNGSFCIWNLSVRSVVNRILGLVPPNPCAIPQDQWDLLDLTDSTLRQGPMQWLAISSSINYRNPGYQLHPISLSTSSKVTGLSHQSQWLCRRHESNPVGWVCEAVTLHMS